jgi:hypothetical protein
MRNEDIEDRGIQLVTSNKKRIQDYEIILEDVVEKNDQLDNDLQNSYGVFFHVSIA